MEDKTIEELHGIVKQLNLALSRFGKFCHETPQESIALIERDLETAYGIMLSGYAIVDGVDAALTNRLPVIELHIEAEDAIELSAAELPENVILFGRPKPTIELPSDKEPA